MLTFIFKIKIVMKIIQLKISLAWSPNYVFWLKLNDKMRLALLTELSTNSVIGTYT